jgi:hypothetical protein
MLGFAGAIERFAAEAAARKAAVDARAERVTRAANLLYERAVARMDPLLSVDDELALKADLHAHALWEAEHREQEAERWAAAYKDIIDRARVAQQPLEYGVWAPEEIPRTRAKRATGQKRRKVARGRSPS